MPESRKANKFGICARSDISFYALVSFSESGNFQYLCDLIILEQFEKSFPENIATHISNQRVRTVMEAADYVLDHEHSFGEMRTHNTGNGEWANGSGYFNHSSISEVRGHSLKNSQKVGHFCHKKGHSKVNCYALKAKHKRVKGAVGKVHSVGGQK